ncbi:MAG: oligo-1,6-glucosidase [Cyclobacteriaceae bacterium]|jgi:oligo-1,6-glucosidase
MGPHLHDYLKEMNQEVFSKYDVFSVSEGAGSTFEDAHSLVDADRDELHMAYHFKTVDLVNSLDGYKVADLKKVFSEWDNAFAEKGWISIFLANHDVSRLVSRFGNDSPEYRGVSTQLLNTFLLSMRGTPYIYYGDELGMTNIDFQKIDQYQDIAAINGYKKALSEGEDMELFMKKLNFLSRDNGRTPMQWDGSENSGFTTGKPWLPVNQNYVEINVKSQESNPESTLNHFRKMTKLRSVNKVLVYGKYELLETENDNIYAYTRALGDDKMLVVLNFAAYKSQFQIPEGFSLNGEVINNYPSISQVGKVLDLEPYQAIIYKLN